jgi:hypothetical protein
MAMIASLRAVRAAVCGLGLALAAAGSLHGQEALRDGTRDPAVHNVRLGSFVRGTEGGREVATFSYRRSGANYLRVEIGALDLKAGDVLEIRGAEDTGGPFMIRGPVAEVPAELSSLFIRGDEAELKVTSDDLDRAALTLASIQYQDRALAPWKSIFGRNDMVGIRTFAPGSPILGVSRAVVFISFMKEGEMRVCSGFLIAPDRIMTNHHCLGEESLCPAAQIIFDYERDEHGHIAMGEVRRCASLLASDEALDYAVVALDRPADERIPLMRLAAADGAIGAPAALIQHPGGDHKQVSEVGCQIISIGAPGSAGDRSETDFTHRCDTINGSSGSPIVSEGADRAGADCVIGLHHWGFVSGGPYETLNRAVRAPLIAASLAEKGLTFGSCQSQ